MEDKLIKYEKIILTLLEEFAEAWSNEIKQASVVADTKRKHYQLLNIGWQGSSYLFYVSCHFSIKNGKVWIQENRTDVVLADELVERGIPKSDIVLGLKHPNVRPHTGFAVA